MSTYRPIFSCTNGHVLSKPASKGRFNTCFSDRTLSGRFTSSSGRNSMKLKFIRDIKKGKGLITRAVVTEDADNEMKTDIVTVEDPQSFTPSPYATMDYPSQGKNMRPEVQVLTATSSELEQEQLNKALDRLLNATLVGAAAAYALTKMLTVDQDYWHGWTFYEIIKYAPIHNWSAYEEALKAHPVLAKMMISGVVYSIGDWMAQCYEGKPMLDFSRTRMLRSGLVGFCLHGSLSHFYYHFCEAIFPFQNWWVVPLKVAFDQTIWSAFWNSVYYITLGLLRFENPVTIFTELRATFFPLLTAGWKLWPFAHLITYGLVPVEQRLLWVDCVELVWVTILSMYSNEKAEARILEDETSNEVS